MLLCELCLDRSPHEEGLNTGDDEGAVHEDRGSVDEDHEHLFGYGILEYGWCHEEDQGCHHEGQNPLGERMARVDVIAHEAPRASLVSRRQVLLVTR